MTKNNENYGRIKEIFNSIDGVNLHDKKGSRFIFTMYLSSQMEVADIDSLELSVRASNGLRRAGYHTVGELCSDISSGTDIRKIRNCQGLICQSTRKLDCSTSPRKSSQP